MEEVDTELDAAKRFKNVQEAWAILDKDVPLLPVAQHNVGELWYPYLRNVVTPRTNAALFNMRRWDDIWMDR